MAALVASSYVPTPRRLHLHTRIRSSMSRSAFTCVTSSALPVLYSPVVAPPRPSILVVAYRHRFEVYIMFGLFVCPPVAISAQMVLVLYLSVIGIICGCLKQQLSIFVVGMAGNGNDIVGGGSLPMSGASDRASAPPQPDADGSRLPFTELAMELLRAQVTAHMLSRGYYPLEPFLAATSCILDFVGQSSMQYEVPAGHSSRLDFVIRTLQRICSGAQRASSVPVASQQTVAPQLFAPLLPAMAVSPSPPCNSPAPAESARSGGSVDVAAECSSAGNQAAAAFSSPMSDLEWSCAEQMELPLPSSARSVVPADTGTVIPPVAADLPAKAAPKSQAKWYKDLANVKEEVKEEQPSDHDRGFGVLEAETPDTRTVEDAELAHWCSNVMLRRDKYQKSLAVGENGWVRLADLSVRTGVNADRLRTVLEPFDDGKRSFEFRYVDSECELRAKKQRPRVPDEHNAKRRRTGKGGGGAASSHYDGGGSGNWMCGTDGCINNGGKGVFGSKQKCPKCGQGRPLV